MITPTLDEAAIFDAARQIETAADRRQYLEDACAGDSALLVRLDALLLIDQADRGFLERPAEGVAAWAPGGISEAPGQRIGPYKLLEEIGEGGFGKVFMAEQSQPVRRMVALKIIKPGMDTDRVVARFESERQALALMTHPNIAQIIDGSATASGRPYFVMELVRGAPITDFCDQNQYSAAQRLKLFVSVCQAIQHAHHKGIIHRDIKPSNVMVTENDGTPLVKIIDFGVAKAIGVKLAEYSLSTAYGQIVGTPAYMSPEQASMSRLDIDTRSDVYSLGVLLYELLTGTMPIEITRIQDVGHAGIERLIREVEPPRPSTRLGALGDSATLVAANRASDPGRLCRLLSGDLDWIVMKALEKDPNRRYRSPGSFADDVERFLRGEAVLARPPSVTYRLATFVRRNRAAVMAATIAMATLLAGTAVATWQAVVANRAKRIAESAAAAERAARNVALAKEAEARAVLEFVQNRIFAAARPLGQASGLGKDVTLISTLTAALPHVERSFAEQPLVEARLRQTLGNSFLFLGEAQSAADQIERAHAIQGRLLGPSDAATLSSANDLASSYRALGRLDKALALTEQTLEECRALFGPDGLPTLESMSTLATICRDLGRRAEDLDLSDKVLASRRAQLGPHHIDTVKSMAHLASSYAALGRASEALQLDDEALAITKTTLGPDHPDTILFRNNLALDYADVGRYEEALKLHQETRRISMEKLGANHPLTLMSTINVAKALSDLKRHEEALALFNEVFAHQKVKPGLNHPHTMHTMFSIGRELESLERYAESLKWHQDALDLRKAKLGPDHRDTLFSMWGVAVNLFKLKRGSEALPIADECLERAAADPARDFSGLADRRLDYCAEGGDADGCIKTAELWEKMQRTDAASLYNAARYRAVAAGILSKGDRGSPGNTTARTESDRAMAWLRQAVAAGFRDKDKLAKTKELDSVRDRADFRELIAGLEAKLK